MRSLRESYKKSAKTATDTEAIGGMTLHWFAQFPAEATAGRIEMHKLLLSPSAQCTEPCEILSMLDSSILDISPGLERQSHGVGYGRLKSMEADQKEASGYVGDVARKDELARERAHQTSPGGDSLKLKLNEYVETKARSAQIVVCANSAVIVNSTIEVAIWCGTRI